MKGTTSSLSEPMEHIHTFSYKCNWRQLGSHYELKVETQVKTNELWKAGVREGFWVRETFPLPPNALTTKS